MFCRNFTPKLAALTLLCTVLVCFGTFRSSSIPEARPKIEAATDISSAAASSAVPPTKTKQALPFPSTGPKSQVRESNHSKAAVKDQPVPNNPKEHVPFRILRPVNWHLVDTIEQYPITPDAQKNLNAGAKEIYFSVKTTRGNHETRLAVLILSWLQTVLSNQVNIVTDRVGTAAADKWANIARLQGFNIVPTNCSMGHNPWMLCCKSGHEFEGYYLAQAAGKNYKWFCHFDDDVYVNVPMLTAILSAYNPSDENIYIGRGPKKRLYVPQRPKIFSHYHKFEYKFAYGASYCISSALMGAMEKFLRGNKFYDSCVKLRTSDDLLLGVIIEAVLGYSLIHNDLFNSHYNLQPYTVPELKKQVTVSYLLKGTQNLILLSNATFSEEKDPTRFFSYHCLLYPQTRWCNDVRL